VQNIMLRSMGLRIGSSGLKEIALSCCRMRLIHFLSLKDLVYCLLVRRGEVSYGFLVFPFSFYKEGEC